MEGGLQDLVEMRGLELSIRIRKALLSFSPPNARYMSAFPRDTVQVRFVDSQRAKQHLRHGKIAVQNVGSCEFVEGIGTIVTQRFLRATNR